MKQSFKIYIAFDNKCHKPRFLPGFGFSVLIYNYFTENFSSFDTGGSGDTVIHIIKKFNVNISAISNIIISHAHYDHAGGLVNILQINPDIKVYVPNDEEKGFSDAFPNNQIYGFSEITEIETNLFTSGQIKGKFIPEHSVFLKTKDNELIILVGCVHPGLEQFIIIAQNFSRIRAIIGGFHGFKDLSYLRDIDFIGACH